MEKFKFIEPELIEAGSDKLRLGLMRYAPKVDCRVLSEDTYQELKKAYDIVCESQKANTGAEQCNLPVVTVSLPSDKVIEDWYTKDFDSLTVRFWEEAPYCTHGDRVEEIKDAVHYFITGNER